MKKGLWVLIIFASMNCLVAYPSETTTCPTPKKSNPYQENKKNIKAVHTEKTDVDNTVNETLQSNQLVFQYENSLCERGGQESKDESDNKYDFLKFILELLVRLISVLAWPIVTFLILIKFKSELSHLIKRIKKLSLAGSEVEISDLPDVDKNDQSEKVTPEQKVKATLDPRGSIIAAWLNLEAEIYNLYQMFSLTGEPSLSAGLKDRFISPKKMVHYLLRNEFLSNDEAHTILNLFEIRNRVAHEIDFSVSEGEVVKYITVANDMESSLKKKFPNGHRF